MIGRSSDKKKFSFGVLDVFLILLVLVSAAGICARYILTDENGVLAVAPEKTEAAVSVIIENIESTSSDYFYENAEFTVTPSGVKGTLMANFTVTPAQYYIEGDGGELIIAYHDEENGNVDVRGVLRVTGYYKDDVYLLGEGTPVTAGMTVTLSGETITVTATVTDITPIVK